MVIMLRRLLFGQQLLPYMERYSELMPRTVEIPRRKCKKIPIKINLWSAINKAVSSVPKKKFR